MEQSFQSCNEDVHLEGRLSAAEVRYVATGAKYLRAETRMFLDRLCSTQGMLHLVVTNAGPGGGQ